MTDLTLEDLNLTRFVPDEYDEVVDALVTFAMHDSSKWKARQRIVIRKRFEKIAANLTRINERYQTGDIDEAKYKRLMKINAMVLENVQIEVDLLDEQARQIVIKRGKEVIAAIARAVTGIDVDSVLGIG